MSIAVNLDNGIKLVEPFWDFSLQSVRAPRHRNAHTHCEKVVWALLINKDPHVHIRCSPSSPITVTQTDLCGTKDSLLPAINAFQSAVGGCM